MHVVLTLTPCYGVLQVARGSTQAPRLLSAIPLSVKLEHVLLEMQPCRLWWSGIPWKAEESVRGCITGQISCRSAVHIVQSQVLHCSGITNLRES